MQPLQTSHPPPLPSEIHSGPTWVSLITIKSVLPCLAPRTPPPRLEITVLLQKPDLVKVTNRGGEGSECRAGRVTPGQGKHLPPAENKGVGYQQCTPPPPPRQCLAETTRKSEKLFGDTLQVTLACKARDLKVLGKNVLPSQKQRKWGGGGELSDSKKGSTEDGMRKKGEGGEKSAKLENSMQRVPVWSCQTIYSSPHSHKKSLGSFCTFRIIWQ